MTKLLKAIEDCDLDKVKEIVDKDSKLVNVVFKSWHERTPLAVALSCGQYEMAYYLIKMGADVNVPDGLGDRPLDLSGKFEVAKKLIELGANVNLCNKIGYYPIHRWNTPELDKLFVQHGADPNSRSRQGQTPIHLACLRDESVERIKGLVELGANIWLRDFNGKHIFNYLEEFAASTPGQFEDGKQRAINIENYFNDIVE